MGSLKYQKDRRMSDDGKWDRGKNAPKFNVEASRTSEEVKENSERKPPHLGLQDGPKPPAPLQGLGTSDAEFDRRLDKIMARFHKMRHNRDGQSTDRNDSNNKGKHEGTSLTNEFNKRATNGGSKER